MTAFLPKPTALRLKIFLLKATHAPIVGLIWAFEHWQDRRARKLAAKRNSLTFNFAERHDLLQQIREDGGRVENDRNGGHANNISVPTLTTRLDKSANAHVAMIKRRALTFSSPSYSSSPNQRAGAGGLRPTHGLRLGLRLGLGLSRAAQQRQQRAAEAMAQDGAAVVPQSLVEASRVGGCQGTVRQRGRHVAGSGKGRHKRGGSDDGDDSNGANKEILSLLRSLTAQVEELRDRVERLQGSEGVDGT